MLPSPLSPSTRPHFIFSLSWSLSSRPYLHGLGPRDQYYNFMVLVLPRPYFHGLDRGPRVQDHVFLVLILESKIAISWSWSSNQSSRPYFHDLGLGPRIVLGTKITISWSNLNSEVYMFMVLVLESESKFIFSWSWSCQGWAWPSSGLGLDLHLN